MRKPTVLPTLAAVVMLFLVCRLFAGAPDNAGVLASMDPLSAVKGLGFTLAFAAGMPAPVAVGVALALFVMLPVAVFVLVRAVIGVFCALVENH